VSWTTASDLRAQVQRLWERGDLLRPRGAGAIDWPLRLALKTPTAADLTERFDAVRAWAAALAAARHVRIEWRERRHRVQGMQRLPAAVWVDAPEDALALVGRRREAQTFRETWEQTAAQRPALLPWLERRPLQALELAERWPRLCAVVDWIVAHPRPGVYLRQVDVPGVDSKFIEAHRGVLAELLDLALPPEAVDASAGGAAQFTRRYGFLDKPVRIRFRVLDPALALLPGATGLADVTLDARSFSTLALPVHRVFVIENEIDFLAFPPVADAAAIFGAGYGWEALARAAWLQRCALHYWGDIDTHGFAILDQLRAHFPHAASFLMDRATLLAHEAHWGEEREPARHDLPRLSVDEAALYDDLRHDRIRPRLRLEQERIAYGWFVRRLALPG